MVAQALRSFCPPPRSIASFEEGELGTAIPGEELPPHIAARMAAAQHTAPPLAATMVRKGGSTVLSIGYC